MLKIGITGQPGFIGTHLYNTLGLFPDKYQRINFQDSFFDDEDVLCNFVSQCDVIVHLAAMNRHNDPNTIYETNIRLVKQLTGACEKAQVSPHILFSSSTQEERDNLYGRSKKEGRLIFQQFAEKNESIFTGFIIPNVFGSFGNPYYNSVVATFCYQLTHNEIPKVDNDAEVNLIYVGELVAHMMQYIDSAVDRPVNEKSLIVNVPHTGTITVKKLLEKLVSFKSTYFEKGIMPTLENDFERNLFNTFVTYIDHKNFFPYKLLLNSDMRGSFVEIIKHGNKGQVSFSTTKPGITRGNHFHTRKFERFAVIKGKADIEIRRIGSTDKITFELDGETPAFVDMPVWFTHNITNTGTEDLYTVFWISEHFVESDTDTFFEKV